ncbi:SGNH/GDSL hydrolase family protein [Chitinophagaceae bacterium 26-R-25]|nr:SGNH/GDSL hydrolase family protein [Chitinophagaceae bacterium 26-R-25]
MESKKRYHLFKSVFFIGMITLLNTGESIAQSSDDLSKIEASQGGASPLLFEPKGNDMPLIAPGNFVNASETAVREGLGNFFHKIENAQPVTVAFIGGSITQGNFCYRLQIARYLQHLYPKVSFKWVNAGVSGTGTDLAAFRLKEQVLDYKPDLVFIEFAVNKAYAPGMEGLIRQIIKSNPQTDICLLYTILNGQTKIYQDGKIPENIARLDSLAAYYKLPSIHLGMEAAELEKEGALIWKNDKPVDGKILFSNDGIHPLAKGGNLYAAAIARGLEKIEKVQTLAAHQLQPPLITDSWDSARMFDPFVAATFDANWKFIRTADSVHFKQFSNWFNKVAYADQPGASFTFRFKGDLFGIFDIGGPEAGQLQFKVDGHPVLLQRRSSPELIYYVTDNTQGEPALDRFNFFCNNRYRGQHDLVQLTPGVHEITVTISDKKADKKAILTDKQSQDISQHPEKYDRTAVYIGKILIRGQII